MGRTWAQSAVLLLRREAFVARLKKHNHCTSIRLDGAHFVHTSMRDPSPFITDMQPPLAF